MLAKLARGLRRAARVARSAVGMTQLGVLLELPTRCAKRVRDRDVHVLVSPIAVGVASDRNVSSGHSHLEADVEVIALPMLAMWLLDHDGAVLDPVVVLLYALHPALDGRLDGGAW